jgi:hypothetical protein
VNAQRCLQDLRGKSRGTGRGEAGRAALDKALPRLTSPLSCNCDQRECLCLEP